MIITSTITTITTYLLILSMIANLCTFFIYDNPDPCFESIWLKIYIILFNIIIMTSFLCGYLLFNCSKRTFFHFDNIGRPKLCDTIGVANPTFNIVFVT